MKYAVLRTSILVFALVAGSPGTARADSNDFDGVAEDDEIVLAGTLSIDVRPSVGHAAGGVAMAQKLAVHPARSSGLPAREPSNGEQAAQQRGCAVPTDPEQVFEYLSTCPTTPAARQAPAAAPAPIVITSKDVSNLLVNGSGITRQPSGAEVLLQLDAIAYTSPDPRTLTTDVNGTPVTVKATPHLLHLVLGRRHHHDHHRPRRPLPQPDRHPPLHHDRPARHHHPDHHLGRHLHPRGPDHPTRHRHHHHHRHHHPLRRRPHHLLPHRRRRGSPRPLTSPAAACSADA